LVQNGNFIPDQAESDRALQEAVVSDLTKFRLQGDDKVYRYIEIRTADGYVKDGKKFKPQNEEERKGLGVIFTPEYLTFLNNNPVRNVEVIRACFLAPEYVRKEARTLWRASWLINFGNYSYFSACNRIVDSNYRLRGVRLVSGANQVAPQAQDAKRVGFNLSLEQFLLDSLPFVIPERKGEYDTLVRERLGKVLK